MLAAVTYEYSECPARVVDEIYIIIFSYDQTKWKVIFFFVSTLGT